MYLYTSRISIKGAFCFHTGNFVLETWNLQICWFYVCQEFGAHRSQNFKFTFSNSLYKSAVGCYAVLKLFSIFWIFVTDIWFMNLTITITLTRYVYIYVAINTELNYTVRILHITANTFTWRGMTWRESPLAGWASVLFMQYCITISSTLQLKLSNVVFFCQQLVYQDKTFRPCLPQ